MPPRLAALALALAVLSACLSAPPDSIRSDGGGGGDSDGASLTDGASPPCPISLDLPLTSEDDLAGWATMAGDFCSQQVTGLGLEFTNQGYSSTCSSYADQLVDLTGRRLKIRLHDADPNLSMTFSVIVGSPDVDFFDRRWLYFERDQGQVRLGECSPDIGGCIDTFWGMLDYVPSEMAWLSFSHAPDDNQLLFETSDDGNLFRLRAAANGVTSAAVACVGVDLGSYEVDTSKIVSSSSFSNLATD